MPGEKRMEKKKKRTPRNTYNLNAGFNPDSIALCLNRINTRAKASSRPNVLCLVQPDIPKNIAETSSTQFTSWCVNLSPILFVLSSFSFDLLLITLQHALDQVAEGAPEVLARGEAVLVDEEDVLLEACVEVGLEAELADDGVVVAVDMGVDAVHALEDLADERGEGLGEGDADARGHHRLVVDVALHPRHELLDVGRGRHLGGSLVRLAVLPEVLEPVVWVLSVSSLFFWLKHG